MKRRLSLAAVFAATLLFAAAISTGASQAPPPAPTSKNADSWQIPPTAADEKNPIEPTEQVLKKGAQIYESKCQKCHGKSGKGDGPEGEPDEPPGDLTDSARAGKNPDGVMFYKVWNGRQSPKMPAFKTDLSRTDVWTVIHFVKKFRQ